MAAEKTSSGVARNVQTNLGELLNEARRDILSQAGRVLPDLRILHGFKEAALAGGVVDDREYFVRAQAYFRCQVEGTNHLNRLKISYNLLHRYPMAPRLGVI